MSGDAPIREDFREILRLVRPGARVLDVGCGEGELLDLLRREKGVDARGLEIDPRNVATCLARGLAVMQGDADRDLGEFPEGAFDYAVLSQTLQAVKNPREVLGRLMRLAERAIVSFPNFGHWRVRLSLLMSGRMPETRALPAPWWETANIHLCTLRDFTALCEDLGLSIEAAAALSASGPARPMDPYRAGENWRAEQALLLLSRGGRRRLRLRPSSWPRSLRPPTCSGEAPRAGRAGAQPVMAAASRSPVRMRTAASRSSTKTLPSPILPVDAARAMASTTRSAMSAGAATSTFTLGRRRTSYSAPR